MFVEVRYWDVAWRYIKVFVLIKTTYQILRIENQQHKPNKIPTMILNQKRQNRRRDMKLNQKSPSFLIKIEKQQIKFCWSISCTKYQPTNHVC